MDEELEEELLQLETDIGDVDIEMLFNFDKYLVPMESEYGLEMLQLDKNTPAATEVLHGAIGASNLQAQKKAGSIVDHVFSGMKNMIHKGM